MKTSNTPGSEKKKEPNIERAQELLEQASRLFEEAIRELGPDSSFSDFETTVLEKGNEMQRDVIERGLQERSDALASRVIIRKSEWSFPKEGKIYRRHQAGEGKYYSLCGELRVRRDRYREVGGRFRKHRSAGWDGWFSGANDSRSCSMLGPRLRKSANPGVPRRHGRRPSSAAASGDYGAEGEGHGRGGCY